MGKVLTVRVDEGLAAWAEGYAVERGATRAQIHEAALRHFRGLCASGVPDLPEAKSGGRPKGEESATPPSDLAVQRAARIAQIRAKAAASVRRDAS